MIRMGYSSVAFYMYMNHVFAFGDLFLFHSVIYIFCNWKMTKYPKFNR